MKTKTSTTVWTNHGEPQPLDDKHFGVALEAGAATGEGTAPRVMQSDIDKSLEEKRREESEHYMDENYAMRVTAQRDELLAALKDVFKVVESRVSNAELNNWQELLAAGRDAIANASK